MEPSDIGYVSAILTDPVPAGSSLIGWTSAILGEPSGWVVLTTLTNQTLLIVGRHADQQLRFQGSTYSVGADGGEIRIQGTGRVDLGTGWWDQVAIVDGDYAGPFFTGDTPSASGTAHTRIERSLDLGQTWEAIADQLPSDVGLDDWTVPLNRTVHYRAVAVSELGTEAVSEAVEVDTDTDRLWLQGEDGSRFSILLDLAVDLRYGHEQVSEQYYGRARPVAHYGDARPITAGVSGKLVDGYGLEDDHTLLLGQDVFYRDPAGRAFWSSISPDGIQLPQDRHVMRQINLTLEAIDVETGSLGG